MQQGDDEYMNTWSSDSWAYFEEGVGPCEMGWGSHEMDLGEEMLYEERGYKVLRACGFSVEC